jgi:hypothetical protein
MRHRSRLWYGGLELLIALAAFYFVLLGMVEVAKPMTIELVVGRMLIFFVAIYFMVRALEITSVRARVARHWPAYGTISLELGKDWSSGMKAGDKIQLPSAVAKIYEAVEELRKEFPGRPFAGRPSCGFNRRGDREQGIRLRIVHRLQKGT